jgi:putative ABC transport system substrate-binding protein
MNTFGADQPEWQARLATLRQGLEQLGWIDGGNMRIELRWGSPADDANDAAQVVALAPDIILAQGSTPLAPLLKATRTIPIVFTIVADPVGAGYVESLAHPGGNATGFLTFDYGISAKWLEFLKEIAPNVSGRPSFEIPPLLLGQLNLLQSRPLHLKLGWR